MTHSPSSNPMLGCDYQGHEFGAHYLDSVCIEGYLWDADSGDADGLTNGGDLPCPQCNGREWKRYHADSVIEDAYQTAYNWEWPFRRVRGGWRNVLWGFWNQLRGVSALAWEVSRGKA